MVQVYNESIPGEHSNQDHMCFVKILEYVCFMISYLVLITMPPRTSVVANYEWDA